MPRRWCHAQIATRLARELSPPAEGARGAGRDRAAPAIAREDRVAVPRLSLPLAADVLEQLLAALPERLAGRTEGVERGAEERDDGRGRGERDVGIERLVGARTHLPLDGSEGGVG